MDNRHKIDNEEQVIEDSLTNAIQSLFLHRIFLPRYPFQSIIPTLLHYDAFPHGLKLHSQNYFATPPHFLYFTVQIAKFGGTGFVGPKHIAKFISTKSLQLLHTLTNVLHEALGSPTTSLTTEHITANYIEVYPFTNGLSFTLSHPKLHKLDMILEVMIKAKSFDECMNVFIRKVLEDAHKITVGNNMIPGDICIYNTGQHTLQRIEINSMKAKRQQVLALLKAAIVNEQEISLEFYLLKEHSLPVLESKFTHYRENSMGFVYITRKYKLSYTDNSDNIRCFTKFPLESLTLGLFNSLEDADMCVQAYTNHMQRLEANVKSKGKDLSYGDLESFSDTLLNNYLSYMSKKIYSLWEAGEYVECMEKMMILIGIFESNKQSNSAEVMHLLEEVKVIQMHKAGHAHIIRQIVQNFRKAIELFSKQIDPHSALFMQYLNSNSKPTEEDEHIIQKHIGLLGGFSSAIYEVKQLVQELLAGAEDYTELHYMKDLLLNALGKYFEESITRTRNKLETHNSMLTKRILTNKSQILQEITSITLELEFLLKSLETNISIESLYQIIAKDVQSYIIGIELGSNKKDLMYASRNINEELPKCLLDLLGFTFMRYNGRGRNFNSKQWKPINISKVFFSLAEVSLPSNPNNIKPVNRYEKDVERVITYQENNVNMFINIYDLYAYLQSYHIYRYSALNAQHYRTKEIQYGDMPSVILGETARLRYLRDVEVLQILQRSRFETVSCPRQISRPLVLHTSLLALATKTQSHLISDLDPVKEKVFYVARHNMITLHAKSMLEGPYKLLFRSLPSSQTALLSGGVLGNDRLLTALGQDYEDIFVNVWNLPGLLPQPPRSNLHMKVKVFGGLSVHTALQWSYLLSQKNNYTNESDPSEKAVEAYDESMRYSPRYKSHMLDSSSKIKHSSLASSNALRQPKVLANTDKNERDIDTGSLIPCPTIKKEVIYCIEYDQASLVSQVKKTFAQEVCSMLQFMMISKAWQIDEILIPNTSCEEIEDEENFFLKSSCTRFSGEMLYAELGSEVDEKYREVERCLIRSGKAIIHASGLIPEDESKCELAELASLFQQSTAQAPNVYRSNDEEKGSEGYEVRHTAGKQVKLEKDLFQFAPRVSNADTSSSVNNDKVRDPSSQSMSYTRNDADDKEPSIASAISSDSTNNKKGASLFGRIMGRNTRKAKTNDKSIYSSASTLLSDDPMTASNLSYEGSDYSTSDSEDELLGVDQLEAQEEEREYAEMTSTFDPTYADNERLCSNSFIHNKIADHLIQHKAEQVYCYRPVQITVTLIAKYLANWRKGGHRHKEQDSKALGKRDSSITIGSSADIARLSTSTLYFSSEAAKYIFSLYSSPLHYAQSVYYQTIRSHDLFHHFLTSNRMIDGAEALSLYSILSQNYSILPYIFSFYNSFAVKMFHNAALIKSFTSLIRNSKSFNTLDMYALGMTLMRHVDLCVKYMLYSPNSLHYRGGCSEVCRLLNKVMSRLGIKSIPVESTRSNMKHYTQVIGRSSSSSQKMSTERDNEAEIMHKLTLQRIKRGDNVFNEDALNSTDAENKPATIPTHDEGKGIEDHIKHSHNHLYPTSFHFTLHHHILDRINTFKHNKKTFAPRDHQDGLQNLKQGLESLESKLDIIDMLQEINAVLKCISHASAQDVYRGMKGEIEEHIRGSSGARGEIRFYNGNEVIRMILTNEASKESIISLIERAQTSSHHILSLLPSPPLSSAHHIVPVNTVEKDRVELVTKLLRENMKEKEGMQGREHRHKARKMLIKGMKPPQEAQESLLSSMLDSALQHSILLPEHREEIEERMRGKERIKKGVRKIGKAIDGVRAFQRGKEKEGDEGGESKEEKEAERKRKKKNKKITILLPTQEEASLLSLTDPITPLPVGEEGEEGDLAFNDPLSKGPSLHSLHSYQGASDWAGELLTDTEPKLFLSSFHDQQQPLPSLSSVSFLPPLSLPPPEQLGGFAAGGFALKGRRVREAGEGGSMLQLLRAVGAVQGAEEGGEGGVDLREGAGRQGGLGGGMWAGGIGVRDWRGEVGADEYGENIHPEDSGVGVLVNFRKLNKITKEPSERGEYGQHSLDSYPFLSQWKS